MMDKWGSLDIEFIVGEPQSVKLRVRAMVGNERDLDTLMRTLEASRQLLTPAQPSGGDSNA